MYSPSAVARFWKYVRKTDSCWIWTGSKASQYKYGQLTIVRNHWVYAHRMSYELHVGPIPDGYHICHKCDNPPCVNPDHLFAGTAKDNMQDRERKGRGNRHPEARRQSHCKRGHALEGANLKLAKDGSRRCRTCFNLFMQGYYWRAQKPRRQQLLVGR